MNAETKDEVTYRIAEWADGTWCPLSELEEFLSFMSDDYKVRVVSEAEMHALLFA